MPGAVSKLSPRSSFSSSFNYYSHSSPSFGNTKGFKAAKMLADVYFIIFTSCKIFQAVMKEFQCAALPQVNLVCGLPGVCKTLDRIAMMHVVSQYRSSCNA